MTAIAIKTNSYIPTLDGIRALAILLVLICHSLALDPAFHELGHLGVLLFFALSGYLITTKLLDEFRQRGAINFRAFYLRRAFRILPPALMYLAMLSILFALGWADCDVKSIVAALFFWINYIPVNVVAWNAGHFWSLSVEEHFYLLWPALLMISGVLRGWRIAALLACAICLWRSLYLHWEWFYHTDYIADTLLWGCCLAFVPVRKIAFPSLIFLGLITTFWLLDFGPHAMNGRLGVTIKHLLPAAIVGVIAMSPKSLIGQFLELAPMRHLGKLSYGLYIWQQLFTGRQGILPWWIAIISAFLAAYLSYRFIEKPSIALGRRMIQGREQMAKLEAVT